VSLHYLVKYLAHFTGCPVAWLFLGHPVIWCRARCCTHRAFIRHVKYHSKMFIILFFYWLSCFFQQRMKHVSFLPARLQYFYILSGMFVKGLKWHSLVIPVTAPLSFRTMLPRKWSVDYWNAAAVIKESFALWLFCNVENINRMWWCLYGSYAINLIRQSWLSDRKDIQFVKIHCQPVLIGTLLKLMEQESHWGNQWIHVHVEKQLLKWR